MFAFLCRYSGILSAYGIALADVVHEAQEPSADTYDKGELLFSLIFSTHCPFTFLLLDIDCFRQYGITLLKNARQNVFRAVILAPILFECNLHDVLL